MNGVDPVVLRAGARHEFLTALRSRALVLVTAVAVLLVAGYLVLQSTVLDAPERASVGLSGQATALQDALAGAAHGRGLDIEVTDVPDAAAGREQVRNGSLDALVNGSPAELQVLVRNGLDEDLRALLDGLQQQQVLLSQVTQLAQTAQSDVDPQAVAQAVASATVAVHVLESVDPQRGQRLALALVATLLLFGAIVLGAARLTVEVADERAAQVSEVLFGAAPPKVLLAGRLLGASAAGALCLFAIAVVGLIVAWASGVLTLTGAGIGTVVWGLVWGVLGTLGYGDAGMAAGALVPGRWAATKVLLAVAALPAFGTALGFGLMIAAPDNTVLAILSMLPPFAPFLLPGLVALGTTSALQVITGLVLTIAAVALTHRYAVRVHTGGVLAGSDNPVQLRDALSP